ncbi:heparinase II/III family protein [Maricaulis sp.]|uniref:heparinase II/III family protein n=1 Tax=Maricaulis sp. TaxID=1486257 RepID=UPI003A8FE4B9
MAGAVRLSDYPIAAIQALRREASSTVNAIGLLRSMRALGPIPEALCAYPADFYSGDAGRGTEILAGRFALAGDQLDATSGKAGIWSRSTPSRAFARSLHGFGWLRDCAAADESGDEARRLVDAWIKGFGRWNSFAWSQDVLSSRLMNWLRSAEILFAAPAGGDEDEIRRHAARLRCLVRQTRYLQRALPLAPDGIIRLRCAAVLTLAGLCLPGEAAMLKAAISAYSHEIDRQILPDGGHLSRAPRAVAEALIDLVTVRDVAAGLETELPASLQRAVERLAPMARFFQTIDGGLASFHGGGEGDRAALAAVLERGDIKSRTFGFAPHSGYQRAHAGGATVMLDVGEPPRGALSVEAHASALAFELCTASARLVVNCGWADDQPANWREAVRATAAHSTLTLEETSSARLLSPGWRRTLLGPRLATSPGPVTARRNEEELGVWLEGGHEGYREQYGLSHRRRIFLAADGGDVRGEDALFRPIDDGAPDDVEVRWRFAIRFHLHPGVRASLARDSMSVLLVQPDGAGWRFRCDGEPIRLERSVYLAAGAPPQRATQIVVQGEAEPFGAGDRPPNRVRWAFQRLGRIGGAAGEYP